MKKLGFLLLFLSIGLFSYGCREPESAPTTPPAVDDGTDVDDATIPPNGDADTPEMPAPEDDGNN